MSKYLLVSFKTCPWVQRAAIVLREKKIEFEFRHIEPDNRPDWFLAISPHKKVPVLRVDDKVSLFESNAINEYLDETIAPRLHPEDPVARAVNRAWTDYIPTFSEGVTGCAYADSEADYAKAVAKDSGRRSTGSRRRWKSRAPGRSSTARSIRWSTPPTRRSCSATSSSTASVRSARSRNIRGSRRGRQALMARPSTHSFPARRVRGDVSGEREAPQQVDIAVRRGRGGRGGVDGAGATPLRRRRGASLRR